MPYQKIRISIATEFIGTFALVTLGASTSVWTHLMELDPFRQHIVIAVVVSLTVCTAILTIGKLSGAHINPFVSLSHAITGLMPRRLFLPYLGAQLLAALAAGLFLAVLCRSIKSPDYGLTKLQVGTTPSTGILLEALGTFVLCTVALLASTKLKHSPRKQALVMGSALFLLTAAIGPFTGASFNASRSLGPAIASMNFQFQYVYLIGPLLGSLAASLGFILRGRPKPRGSKVLAPRGRLETR